MQEEYNAILSEIDKQRELSVSDLAIRPNQDISQNSHSRLKFITGGILAWILTICVPFMNTFQDKKSKLLAFFVLALFGGLLGGVGSIIPTFLTLGLIISDFLFCN